MLSSEIVKLVIKLLYRSRNCCPCKLHGEEFIATHYCASLAETERKLEDRRFAHFGNFSYAFHNLTQTF